MSISVLIYKSEAGVHSHSGVTAAYQVSCFEGSKAIPKAFSEVYIHWTGAAWAEDMAYLPGQSIVALRVDNVCTGNFAYIDYPKEDFRQEQLCCSPACPLPTLVWNSGTLPDATIGVEYNQTGHITGSAPFSMNFGALPGWLEGTVDEDTGVVTLVGTPTGPGDVNLNFSFSNCGDEDSAQPFVDTITVGLGTPTFSITKYVSDEVSSFMEFFITQTGGSFWVDWGDGNPIEPSIGAGVVHNQHYYPVPEEEFVYTVNIWLQDPTQITAFLANTATRIRAFYSNLGEAVGNLDSLDLSNQELEVLPSGLPSNMSTLNVSNNNLIGEVDIRTNTFLKDFLASDNQITSVRMLKPHNSFRKLNLKNNDLLQLYSQVFPFTGAGRWAMPNIVELNFSDNVEPVDLVQPLFFSLVNANDVRLDNMPNAAIEFITEIMEELAGQVTPNGYFSATGTTVALDATCLAHKATLQGRGWTVNNN